MPVRVCGRSAACVVDLRGVCRVSTSTVTSGGASRRMSTRTSRRTPGFWSAVCGCAWGCACSCSWGCGWGCAGLRQCGRPAVALCEVTRQSPAWSGTFPALTSPLQPFSDNHGGVGGGCAVLGNGVGLRRRGGARRRGLRAPGAGRSRSGEASRPGGCERSTLGLAGTATVAPADGEGDGAAVGRSRRSSVI